MALDYGVRFTKRYSGGCGTERERLLEPDGLRMGMVRAKGRREGQREGGERAGMEAVGANEMDGCVR